MEGIQFLTDFWKTKYLHEYIAEGGSKIKFIKGRQGSGKTYFLKQMKELALQENYLCVMLDAKETRLHDFKEIYSAVFRKMSLTDCLKGCADQIIKNMGIEVSAIESGQNFMDYLASHALNDALTRKEIRNQLREMFLENPLLDNNFAIACSMLTGSILGHPTLEETGRQLLISWLEGDKSVKLSLLRALGMSPSKITKYNARHMLRSLAELVHLGGYTGLFVSVDNLEILVTPDRESEIRYTKLRRDDTYESIRQLIDDIDSMHYLFFLFAFRSELVLDEKNGMKSYQALWMRIQNEVVSSRFNRFCDMADLDALGRQVYTEDTLIQISGDLLPVLAENSPALISAEKAREILSRSEAGILGIPALIEQAMKGEEDYV